MIRTGYSFKTAIGHIDDVVNRLSSIGWQHAPIADRMSTFGFVRWTKAAKKAGLRPVYGVELACAPELTNKAPTVDHWRFFAKETLRPLHDLVYRATNGSALLYHEALQAKGLFKISGHLVQLSFCQPSEDFFIGLSPSLPLGLFRKAKAAGFAFCATSDNVYPIEQDRELYRVSLGKRAETQSYPQHILSDDEWRAAVAWFCDEATAESALANRDKILAQCNATMKKAKLLKPQTSYSLRELCEQGAIRTGTDLNNSVYRERLERELKLIEEKQFADYFLILADLINFAKECMVVGPARGSSCGSLVCYLLNITAVDPIPFDLIFERFIDINRTDLPDIDVDFSDEKRHMVFEYAEQKYGHDRVARLGTVLLFRPRSALNQAGIALKIPIWEVEKVLDTVIERSGGDSRALQTLEDTLTDTETGREFIKNYPEARIIAKMEGHPQFAGQHAAGIIITEEPVMEYVAMDGRTRSVMCDKKDSEDLNLLKIDALGLTQLSIFERTLELIGKPPKAGFLETLPLDDQPAFNVLNKGHFAGIFQFNGQVLQSVTKQIPISHIEDIISITAIARPGPAASGGTLAWVKRRTGQEPVTTVHPMLTELTKETYGVVIYQETVMKIVREMGNMSWEDTSAIRKAMSGRLGDEFFEGYWQKFKAGAIANGIDEQLAHDIWRQINTMGSWAFNRSHAVAYGLVSYYCCYLKAHYPVEFAAATLDAEKEPGRQIAFLRELKAEGINYVPVDPEKSTDRWTPNGSTLVGPLTAIKGIGPATVIEIMDARKSGKPLSPSVITKLQNAKTEIDSLYPIADAIKRLHPDLAAAGIITQPTDCRDVSTDIMGDIVVIGVAERIVPLDENEPIRVMRRNGKLYPPPTDALNIFLRDDTDQLLCRIDRFRFPSIGRPVVEHGRPGKAIYALKGFIPRTFRMMMVQRVKHLGDVDAPSIQIHGGIHHKLAAGEQ